MIDLDAIRALSVEADREVAVSSILSCRTGGEAAGLSVASRSCEYRNDAFAGDEEARHLAQVLMSSQPA